MFSPSILMRETRKGFTLIELLVTIGIVVVLASLLLPTVGKIRGQGESAKCMSNLRQLTSLLLTYQSETGNTPDVSPNWDTVALSYFTKPDGNGVPEYSNILHCPSDRAPRVKPRSYSYNPVLFNYNNQYGWAGGGTPNAGLKGVLVPKPSQTAMLMEQFQPANVYNSANWLVTSYVQDLHNGGMNVSFCDGSVRKMSYKMDGPDFFDKHVVVTQ